MIIYEAELDGKIYNVKIESDFPPNKGDIINLQFEERGDVQEFYVKAIRGDKLILEELA